MFRRRFLQRLTFASATGLAGIEAAAAGARKRVTYSVKGFSCVTCAVGLETMLRQRPGVTSATATYQPANVVIEFDPSVTDELSLKTYISKMGFSAERA